jgi:hypothetical protein
MSCPIRGKNKKTVQKFYSAKVKILFNSKWIGIKYVISMIFFFLKAFILNISTYEMCKKLCNTCVIKL